MNYRNFIARNNIPTHYFRDRKHPEIMSMHMLTKQKTPEKKFVMVQEHEPTGVPTDGVWVLDRNTTAVSEDGKRGVFHPCDIVKQV
jgi:hypothetical protein